MNLSSVVFATAFCVAGSLAAAEFAAFAPQAQQATLSQITDSDDVKIAFDLAVPAIVTLDIQTNATAAAEGWASVGFQNLATLSGAVNRLISETGRQTVTWKPGREVWPGLTRTELKRVRFQPGRFRAVVTTWSPKCPPEFMVVDLATPTNVRYFAAQPSVVDSIPGGLTNGVYKTDYLVMRRCDAGRFHEGASTEPSAWNISKKPGHSVVLTRDFYMGVFEFTQGQYKTLTGQEWNCWFGKAKRPDDYLQLPLDGGTASNSDGCGLTYAKLRGTDFAADAIAPGTLLATLREKLGLAVDLPTVAQWERAYRGGEEGYSSFPDGLGAYSSTSSDDTKARAARFCWYSENSAIDGETQPHVVGTREPNPWGLYDMGGNVFEYCRDPLPAYDGNSAIGSSDPTLAWYVELAGDAEKAVDPDTTTSTNAMTRVAFRGGSYKSGAFGVAAFAHESTGTGWSSAAQGFRLCLNLAFTDADNL